MAMLQARDSTAGIILESVSTVFSCPASTADSINDGRNGFSVPFAGARLDGKGMGNHYRVFGLTMYSRLHAYSSGEHSRFRRRSRIHRLAAVSGLPQDGPFIVAGSRVQAESRSRSLPDTPGQVSRLVGENVV